MTATQLVVCQVVLPHAALRDLMRLCEAVEVVTPVKEPPK